MEPLNLLCTSLYLSITQNPPVLPHLCHHHHPNSWSTSYLISPYFTFYIRILPPIFAPPALPLWRWCISVCFICADPKMNACGKFELAALHQYWSNTCTSYNIHILRMEIYFELKFNHLICHSLSLHGLSSALFSRCYATSRSLYWIRYKLCNKLTT